MTHPSIVLDDTQLCSTCNRQLVLIRFMLNGHDAELRSCGLCDRRTLWIDGEAVTREDLLAGMSPDSWTPPSRSDDVSVSYR